MNFSDYAELFWSSVDLTGNQTGHLGAAAVCAFWSSVDLTGNQTDEKFSRSENQFWSSVDLTGNQTRVPGMDVLLGFGAVSI